VTPTVHRMNTWINCSHDELVTISWHQFFTGWTSYETVHVTNKQPNCSCDERENKLFTWSTVDQTAHMMNTWPNCSCDEHLTKLFTRWVGEQLFTWWWEKLFCVWNTPWHCRSHRNNSSPASYDLTGKRYCVMCSVDTVCCLSDRLHRLGWL